MAYFGRSFRFPRVNVMDVCTYTVATLMVINLSMPPPSNPPPVLPFVMITDMVVQHEYRKKIKNKSKGQENDGDVDVDGECT